MKMTTSRPLPGRLLPENDPRVVIAHQQVQGLLRSAYLGYDILWQDAAEIVNAVLAQDDAMHDRSTEWSRMPDAIPDAPTGGPTT